MPKRITRIFPAVQNLFRHRPHELRKPRLRRAHRRTLELSMLEERILFSATPLDPALLDADPIDVDVSASWTDLLGDQGPDSGDLLTAAGFELIDVHEHDEHCDSFGDGFHSLPEAFVESDGSASSVNIDSTNDSLVPLSETFRLHSNLGANHTIYLDFDGHTTSGTVWNSSFTGGKDIVTEAYDFDGNAASFSDAELQRIQYIWQRVAEDFIPFNVDVTTEAPSLDELTKSGSGDSTWGVRVVIGGSSYDWYGAGAGGVAYTNAFNLSNDTPVFVFTDNLGNGAEKYTAEAISHETGHSLGLAHDGASGTTYYQGHGSGETGWAPIMGNSYYKNLTQWSSGEYAGATNTQNDLAVITGNNGFGYRADDYGDSNGSASLLDVSGGTVSTYGIIETTNDYDVFSFTTGGGLIDLDIVGAARGSNLDILASLYDSVGTLIVSSNPIGYLDATIQATVSAGQYFLHISGTGQGDPSTGYSAYASLGQYFINGTIAPSNDAIVSLSGTNLIRTEGDVGTTDYSFTVTRSGNTDQVTSVDYSVAGAGSAAANALDFYGSALPAGTVTFAAGETSKAITVRVAGDTDIEADEQFRVTLTNATGDTQLGSSSVTATILTDDVAATPGITVTPTSGLTTKENGSSAGFSVVLDSRPTADVIIDLTSLDTSEGVLNKTQLVFTSSNWNVAQSVTVTGVDDLERDGHTTYTVRLAAARSTDANYNGLDPSDVEVTNQDDEKGNTKAASDTGGSGSGRGKSGKAPSAGADIAVDVELDDLVADDAGEDVEVESIPDRPVPPPFTFEIGNGHAHDRALAALAEAMLHRGPNGIEFSNGTLDDLVASHVQSRAERGRGR